MRPDNVNSILLIGSPQLQKSFLFQFAVHFAEGDETVLYFCPRAIDALPPSFHGVPPPTPASMHLVRFMYLPGWKDLSEELHTIHQYTHIPDIIILEGLNHYSKLAGDNSTTENCDENMQTALVCASLLDAASVCGKHNKKPVTLIVSIDIETKLKFSPEIFFIDTVRLNESKDGDIVVTSGDVPDKMKGTTKIEFRTRTSDGALVLKRILTNKKKHK